MIINHFGIVVADIEESTSYYCKNFDFIADKKIFVDKIQKVRIRFLHPSKQNFMIELLEPLGLDSPVSNFLKKGGGLNHICYEVNNMEEAIDKYSSFGHRQISKPEPAVAFNNRKAVFFYTDKKEIVELIEAE